MPVFQLLVDYCRSPIKHESFYKKYTSKKYLKGKSNPISTLCFAMFMHLLAALLVRQWAKRYHSTDIDGILASKDINYSHHEHDIRP